MQLLPVAGQDETLTQFHAAVTPGISAILNAAQAPGWQHLWDGISPQDQIELCLVQNNILPFQQCLSSDSQRPKSPFSGCAEQDGDSTDVT